MCCPGGGPHLPHLPGHHDEKRVPIVDILSVGLLDARKPRLLKFATKHKAYTFLTDDARDCRLLIDALEAAAAMDGDAATTTFRKLPVPPKPAAGLASAALLERDPAWCEQARSRVVAPPKH